MRFFVFGLIVFLVLILQVALADYFQVFDIKPEFVLMLIIINGFFRGVKEGTLWGGVAGLLLDIAGGSVWGAGTVSGLVAGYVSGLAESSLYKDNRFLTVGVIFLVTLLSKTVSYLLLSIAGLNISPAVAVFRIILPICIYNSLLVLILFKPLYELFTSDLLRQEKEF